jgi:eukaryotic-like serine/threonine-protein kinase
MPAEPHTEETIFTEALEKSGAAERAAFLDHACGNDAGLRARVEKLLCSHQHAPDFLQAPVLTLEEPTPIAERPGSFVGPYKLLEQAVSASSSWPNKRSRCGARWQ